MIGNARPANLNLRLPWLLVFRVAVATALLLLTLTADYAAWPLRRISFLLYAVSIGTYLIVLLVGLLLRLGVSAVFLSVVHVATVILGAALVVQATGGVNSTFSFLYVLAILDAAILGNMPVALACAGCCSAIYGTQLVVQWNQLLPYFAFAPPEIAEFTNAAVSHAAAFFLSAWLAGHLAEQTYRARRDLLRAEALYAVVLDSLPVGVLGVDANGVVRVSNRSAAQILGTSASTLLHQRLPDTLVSLLHVDAPLHAGSVQVHGKPRYLAVSHAPLQSNEARQGAEADPSEVVVIDDRTEVHALEASLRAREKLASLGQLSAAMAHELRNPLAAISGCVELFRNEQSAPQREKLAAIVLREIERLNVLINDFLTYARPSPPQRLPVDVCALTRDVCGMLRQDPTFSGHELVVDAPGRIAINADAGQLRQVLWNLVKNAFEASQPGKAVEVHVGVASESPKTVTLAVCDHGSGISETVLEHMFEPFQTTKERGTGLGLAVVHSIVRAHDGSIEVVSNPASGTQMRVHLPV